ncbi:hypothetical protein [Tropicimonas sp. S265A]|uniref:hypothetical protein n=1 Tax=Tropicimonas sp. S265A TaxID=3415134 RepID=UPI003C7BC578
MDTIVAEAVAQLTALPENTRHQIGWALLRGEGQRELPVIEFTDPTLDRADTASNTIFA